MELADRRTKVTAEITDGIDQADASRHRHLREEQAGQRPEGRVIGFDSRHQHHEASDGQRQISARQLYP